MRIDEKELARMCQGKAEIEGKLEHRAPPGTFRESGFRGRYFKLVKNLLFYFRINEFGAIPDEPMGVLVVENSVVNFNSEATLLFAFEIAFLDEPDKKHVFTARTESDMQQWVKTLRQASYQHWRERYNELKTKRTSETLVLDEMSNCVPRLVSRQTAAGSNSNRSWSNTSAEVPTSDLIKF